MYHPAITASVQDRNSNFIVTPSIYSDTPIGLVYELLHDGELDQPKRYNLSSKEYRYSRRLQAQESMTNQRTRHAWNVRIAPTALKEQASRRSGHTDVIKAKQDAVLRSRVWI
jgi:hypothetical protein